MFKRKIFSLLLFIIPNLLFAGKIEKIRVHSPSMNKDIETIVILPDDYEITKEFPVLYLLHGYSKNQKAWLEIREDLPKLVSRYNMIVVCPDGQNSWYFDSTVNPDIKYETFISDELVNHIDENYKTTRDKGGRAITGFSMGGHGAMWNAIRHQDIFGACGAISGGVDFRPFSEKWEINEVLGEYYENPEIWDKSTVSSLLPLIRPGLAIIFDCGTEDFFHEVNENLHKEMMYRNIKHDYISRPGIHDYPYWRKSIPYQIQFFSDFFNGDNTYRKQLIYSQEQENQNPHL